MSEAVTQRTQLSAVHTTTATTIQATVDMCCERLKRRDQHPYAQIELEQIVSSYLLWYGHIYGCDAIICGVICAPRREKRDLDVLLHSAAAHAPLALQDVTQSVEQLDACKSEGKQ